MACCVEGHLDEDQLWQRLRSDALAVLEKEPALTPLMLSAIIDRGDLRSALAHRLAYRLSAPDLSADTLLRLFLQLLHEHSEIGAAIPCDMVAILQRDPAIEEMSEVFLYMKGFHALTTHRFAHSLWKAGRRHMALYLQSRSSEVFQTDIHPAATVGCGIFIDHATGVVVGETSIIEDDVTLLQNVTLGGTGNVEGDRHPKIRKGAMIGASAKVLGNIEVGEYARVGAGAVVVRSVPPHTTVVGIPAKEVHRASAETAPHEEGAITPKSGR